MTLFYLPYSGNKLAVLGLEHNVRVILTLNGTVGTVSIEKSEVLSKMLSKKGIKHNVLNAKQHEKEAEIVAQIGLGVAYSLVDEIFFHTLLFHFGFCHKFGVRVEAYR